MNNCTKCEVHRDKGNEKGGGWWGGSSMIGDGRKGVVKKNT